MEANVEYSVFSAWLGPSYYRLLHTMYQSAGYSAKIQKFCSVWGCKERPPISLSTRTFVCFNYTRGAIGLLITGRCPRHCSMQKNTRVCEDHGCG